MAHFLANVSVILKLGDIIRSFKRLVHVVSTLCLVNKNALYMSIIDCKIVRIFAYSSTREQSDKRTGAS